MNLADTSEFARELIETAELFGAALSPARIEAYYRALAHVPWEDLQPVMIAARQTERFFPLPSVYLDAVVGSPEAAATDALIEVWAVARAAMRPKDITDEKTHEIVEAMGGWETFTKAMVRDSSMLAAQFRKVYLATRHHVIQQAAVFRAEDALEARALKALGEPS